MAHFIDWRNFAGAQPEKFFKTTLWKGEHVMLGLNCLEPGQSQPVHAHAAADKFYFVLTGEGTFTIGEQTKEAGVGMLMIAPAGIAHGVRNGGKERLSLLVGIAPEAK
jgi:mannose-6-phosphate isomerase-like protein (cupin superfamily)